MKIGSNLRSQTNRRTFTWLAIAAFAVCLLLALNEMRIYNNRLIYLKEYNATLSDQVTRLKQTIDGAHSENLFISAYKREQVSLHAGDSKIQGPSDTTDKVAVDCISAIHHKRTAIILILGQSNAANTVSQKFNPTSDIINFSLYHGKCYLAKDPLIGPTDYGGNFATLLASKLVDRHVYQTVILAPIAVAGATAKEWAMSGPLNRRLVVEIKRLRDAGLQPTQVLWHQGESDANDPGDYTNAFMSIFTTTRRNGVYAPVYVAQASRCGNAGSPELREVQRALVDPDKEILAGPNTDEIGPSYR
jgi:hypothetical protein